MFSAINLELAGDGGCRVTHIWTFSSVAVRYETISPNIGHFILIIGTGSSSKADTRPNSSHYSNGGISRTALPPTPPMSSDTSFEPYNSPSTKSLAQVPVISGTDNYYYETTPPVEDVPRQQLNSVVSRLPMQTQPYCPQAFSSSYLNQPTMPTYYTPSLPTAPSHISGLVYQRPLPQVGTWN
jgi:hypothetical protein